MIIALISTLISSIALAGVAISLLLQARQLRTSQLQAARGLQAELIKLGFDNPDLISDTLAVQDINNYLRGSFVNWCLKSLELGYLTGIYSPESIQVQVTILFGAEFPRDWWGGARDVYRLEATAKREREFFEIVDQTFKRHNQAAQTLQADDEG